MSVRDHGVVRDVAITCGDEECAGVNPVSASGDTIYLEASRVDEISGVLGVTSSATMLIAYDVSTDTQITLILEPPPGGALEMAVEPGVWLSA